MIVYSHDDVIQNMMTACMLTLCMMTSCMMTSCMMTSHASGERQGELADVRGGTEGARRGHEAIHEEENHR